MNRCPFEAFEIIGLMMSMPHIEKGHGGAITYSYCHNGFLLDLDDHKNKWSLHRSFLYGCDRSLGVYVLKLGIRIPNLKQRNWSTKSV